MRSKSSSLWSILFWVFFNIFSSISIVLLNKWIYTKFHFPNITLTCIHFVVCSAGMWLCQRISIFQVKSIPVQHIIVLCLSFSGFVVLTNLSLQYNTVGTYQIIKVLTTPCVMLIQTYWYGKSFTWPVRLTLIPITIGVVMNSYYDVKFNVLGLTIALVGVAITSLYQVLVAEKQAELQVDAMQLLYYQAPISSLFLFIVIPIFEPVIAPGGLFDLLINVASNSSVFLFVLISGLIAFCVNLSTFWIIGNLSPVTYNMVGHTKFCSILLLGIGLFREPVAVIQGVGIFFTLSGVVLYTVFKIQADKAHVLPAHNSQKS